MVVVIDEPKGRYYGGEVGAPVFRDIASHVLRYLEVPQQKDYLRNIRAENPWRRAER
jgi:cell division protein FtsI/penicillin-binding protein 2